MLLMPIVVNSSLSSYVFVGSRKIKHTQSEEMNRFDG